MTHFFSDVHSAVILTIDFSITPYDSPDTDTVVNFFKIEIYTNAHMRVVLNTLTTQIRLNLFCNPR